MRTAFLILIPFGFFLLGKLALAGVERPLPVLPVIESLRRDAALDRLYRIEAEGGNALGRAQSIAASWERLGLTERLERVVAPGVGLRRVMSVAIALHDIGRGRALELGDRRRSLELTLSIAREKCASLGLSTPETDLVLALLDTGASDPVGQYVQGRLALEDAAASLRTGTGRSSLAPSEFAKLEVLFYAADSSAARGGELEGGAALKRLLSSVR